MGWPIVKWIHFTTYMDHPIGVGLLVVKRMVGFNFFFLQMNLIIWMMQPVAKRRARKGKEFNSVILLLVNVILLLVNIDP